MMTVEAKFYHEFSRSRSFEYHEQKDIDDSFDHEIIILTMN